MKNSFDKNNVVLRFPVISDLHIMGSGQETSKKLQKVYEICKREINPNAIMFAGDITDFGLREQIEEFKNITCCNFDLEKTKLFFCIGNHELYNNEILKTPLRVSEDFKEIFGDVVYYGATTDEIKASLHHASICGFDFIAMNAYKYSGGVDYRDEDIFWLEETLKKITDKNPNKPIFICGHAMIIGTNWGSDYGDYWAGSKLYNVFKKYPQVIYFAGHLHFPLQNEKTIWQKEFTTCGTSSIYFSSLEDKNEENLQYNDIVVGSETVDCHEFSQGLFVSVDINGNVKIDRYDFWADDYIKSPWFINAPDKNKEHLNPYCEEGHLKNKKPPIFQSKSFIKETVKDISSPIPNYQITFTAATCEDMVFDYQIYFKNAKTNEVITKTTVYSDFYKSPQTSNMAKILTKDFTPSKLAPFKPFYEEDYYIEIIPRNSFYMAGKSIKSDIIKGVKSEIIDKLINLSPKAEIKPFLTFKNYDENHNLQNNKEYFCWPPVERGDGAISHTVIKTENGKGVCTKLNSGCYQFYSYLSSGENNNFKGFNQICFNLDLTEVKFTRLYFVIKDNGIEYNTDERNGCDMKAYIKENQQWKPIPFNYDGCLENFGGYNGEIRFSLDYFYNSKEKSTAKLENVTEFKIGFSSVDDSTCREKSYTLSNVVFIKD